MKTHSVLFALLIASLSSSIAQAQATAPNPQIQRKQELQLKVFDGRGAIQYHGFTVRNPGAWGTNAALVARLGLTDDQKLKIERALENHRLDLEWKTGLLQKEEDQFWRLLNSNQLNEMPLCMQIEHVVQARAELERTNSEMTLEMREYLTRSQWMQLPRSVNVKKYIVAPKGSIVPNPGRGKP